MSYSINIFPTDEKYARYVKASPVDGELLVNPKDGHLTVVVTDGSSVEFKSATKEKEATLDMLLTLKEELFRDYIKVSDDLEGIVLLLENARTNYITLRTTLNEIYNKILFINSRTEELLKDYNKVYKTYNKFIFEDMDNFKKILSDNTKKLLSIEFIMKELNVLCTDLEAIRATNNSQLDAIIL